MTRIEIRKGASEQEIEAAVEQLAEVLQLGSFATTILLDKVRRLKRRVVLEID